MLPSKRLLNHRDEFVSSFDRLFDSIIKSNYPDFQRSFGFDFFEKSSYPKMNVAVKPEGVDITAEIPGLNKEDVKIKFAEDVLTISGDKKSEAEDSSVVYVIRELKRSSFSRSLKFHQPVQSDNIKASFNDGVLKIFAPWVKTSEAQSEIEVTIE